MTVDPDAEFPTVDVPDELDRLRALRGRLTRECQRVRGEAGTVLPIEFIERVIRESAK